MGWFSGPGKDLRTSAPGGPEVVRFDTFDRILQIPARGHFGPYQRSPNGRFILTWRDGNDEGTQGGARDTGQGRYMLLDGDRIVCEGRMDRPNDGKVADDGTFVLNDWHFFTGELRGTFYAFRATGEVIVRCQFGANLYNSGVSADGRWACCQTCNSGSESDSSVLTVFDLAAGQEVARWVPESGWANDYAFTADGQIILSYLDGSAAYLLSGDFIGRQKWLDAAVAAGELRVIRTVLAEAPPVLPKDLADRLVAACNTGLKKPQNREPSWQADGLRLKAEAYDRSGRLDKALECYDQALMHNPKVGVKRRVQQLRKQLSR